MTVLIRRITALLSLVGLASTQTLYYVSQIAQPTTEFVHQTVSLSAVGVGADGATTYVETGVDSYIAIGYSDATETVLSTPHAFTGQSRSPQRGCRRSRSTLTLLVQSPLSKTRRVSAKASLSRGANSSSHARSVEMGSVPA
ncbi:hypothetical protein B0H10DRAFT_1394333 [Mycena sp. CBHHK59/15]|nr:hypothetical protein B0H10DRAFT_1394333 [Mycena sp. CBHHK59/15]